MYKKILVPTDGSELSNKAVKEAAELLADRVGTGVVVFHTVVEPYVPRSAEGVGLEELKTRLREGLEIRARDFLAEAAKILEVTGMKPEQELVHSQKPYEAIIEAARKHGCDLIVMASHGRSGLSAVLLGSETQKVLTHSEIPVLVVR